MITVLAMLVRRGRRTPACAGGEFGTRAERGFRSTTGREVAEMK